MTAPGDAEANPEPREEEQEIVLRLADILPRVPSHLIKPGRHDPMAEVHFSVEELAEKIARGRVSVPLRRLAAAWPNVFCNGDDFPGEQEIQLPLQKLLEQVGLVAPKPPAPSSIPGDQIAVARAQASRIIEAAQAPPAAPPAAPTAPIAKAISAARHILGILGRSKGPAEQAAPEDTPSKPPPPEPEPAPPSVDKAPAPPEAAPVEPIPAAVPANCISVRVLPIFRLLPGNVLRSGAMPAQAPDARITLPFSIIEPQLAGGHVEIPIEDFVKALPDELRSAVNPVPQALVWVPLDEIFQSLPPDHLYYMPPLGPLPEPMAAPVEITPIEAAGEPAEPAKPAEPAEPAKPAPGIVNDPLPDPPPPPTIPTTQKPLPVNERSPQTPPKDAPANLDPKPEAVAPPADPPPAAPAPSRAPWMRGFQIQAPRLFSGAIAPAEASSEPVADDSTPPPAPTPEARRTADFLASQPGIFAAAAFVEGAVFASADFPRKPDLDALRDFMGAFVDHAREAGRRLGWNGVLTIACEQFHLTAVVRESHFVVALHHDRVLTSLAHDALLSASDDLSKAAK